MGFPSFDEEDRILPALTLVLYYGRDEWKRPSTLLMCGLQERIAAFQAYSGLSGTDSVSQDGNLIELFRHGAEECYREYYRVRMIKKQ